MTNENTTGRGLVDKAVGKVKETAGRVAGRDDLAEEGELQQARGEQVQEAGERQAEADQVADEARVQADMEANAVERARVETELDEQQRLDAIAAEQRAEEARTGIAADQYRDRVDQEVAAEEAELDRKETAAVVGEAVAEDRAEAVEHRADEAERAADTLADLRRNIEEEG